MIHNLKISFILICCLASGLYSQKNSDKGDKYFDQNQFTEAIKYYSLDIKARDKKTSEHAMLRLADCYRITGEFEKAEETYRKILKRKKKDPINYLNYGLSLKSSAKYAEAIIQFKEYIVLKPEDPMGKMLLLSCDSAQKWLDETIGKEVKNIEKINTEQSEFSPVLYPQNKLYFASSRNGSKEALISFDGGGEIHRMDLYSIDMSLISNKENKKTDIINLKEINSPMHDGSACFTKDGNEIYFTKTVKGKRNLKTNDILFTLQVFYSRIDSTGKWTKPASAFSFNSMDYSVGHPSLSNDEQTIYFMSDKPGGYGKTDIYYSVKQKDGSWGKPVNAGNSVNTFGYELFPYMSEEGKLYFSSNAHPGMGQLDIFFASYNDGKWLNVQNVKPPINSIGNDFAITLDGKNNRGFFSSDRFNGKGAEDIYSFSNDIPLEIDLTKDSLHFLDKEIFDDIKYKLVNETDSTEVELTPSNGAYSVKLNYDQNYTLLAKKMGFPYNKIKIKLNCDRFKKEVSLFLSASDKSIVFKTNLVACNNQTSPSANTSEIQAYSATSDGNPIELIRKPNGYFSIKELIPASNYQISFRRISSQ